MVELGLNSHHQDIVLSYLKFARYLRGQSIKTVTDAFKNAAAVLFDNTYTQDEVKKILDDVQTIVTCDVEGEMCSFTHNNILMLQQLFTQAESWHLRMDVHLSELQNRDLLEMIQQLEVDETILKPAKEDTKGENAIALLRIEIERLTADNERLENLQRQCADKLEQNQEELIILAQKLERARVQIEAYRKMSPMTNSHIDEGMVAEMAVKLHDVEELLHTDQESSRQRQAILINELNSTKESVAQVRSQLKLAETELERKFSETKAYANMKQILVSKNEQIKKLRSKLQTLGGTDNQCSEEELV